jgi:hypothetical protein
MDKREYYTIYPVPLLGGVVARLELPTLLLVDDAEKIARVVLALAKEQRAEAVPPTPTA